MDGATIPLQCKVCCKMFTGAVPAQQHFASQEHKKKEASYREASSKSDSETFCTACNKTCDTPHMLQIHSQSPRHLAQLKKQKVLFEQPNATSAIAKSSFGATALHSTPIEQKDDSGYTFDGLRGFCNVCNIDLTSNAHKRDHVNGKPHQKKLVLWKSTNQGTHRSTSGADNDNLGTRNNYTFICSNETKSQKSQYLGCDVCGVTFTCDLSKSQHVASEKHRNKIKKMEEHANGQNTSTRCNACNIDLRDDRSIEEHFKCSKHKLNASNIKLQSKMVTQSSHDCTSHAYGDLISQQRDSQNDVAANRHISETNVIKPLLKVAMHEHVTNTQTARLENSHVVDGSSCHQPRGDTKLLIKPIPSSLEHEESLSETKIIQEMSSLNFDSESSRSDIDNSPVKCIWNDLKLSLPIGRGSYLQNPNKQQTEVIPGKKFNLNNGVKHYQSSAGEIDQSITWPKTVYCGETDCHGDDRNLSFFTKCRETAQEHENKTNATENTMNCFKPFQQQETILSQMPLHSRRASSEAACASGNEDYYFSNEINRGQCYICNLELTSRNHMSQHVTGKNHLKAKGVRQQMEVDFNNSLICTICTVTFTGIEAKQQHMESEKHKNKERIFQVGGHEFYCANCKIVCTGQGSYQQHLSGAQHRKMASVVVPDVIIGTHNTDKTQWYPCNICSCQMNTLQQLKIHEQSPSHLAKLSRQQTGNAVTNGDQTIWHTCEVCNCKLNTHQQLQIHEQSPKHLEKLRKVSPVTQQASQQQQFTKPPLPMYTSNHGYVSGDNLLSPLESFLSLELFPDEFLPKSVSESKSKLPSQDTLGENVEPFELQITTEHLPWTEHSVANCNSPAVSAASISDHVGFAKQSPCSDLAWATRSKGTSEGTTSRPMGSGSQLSNNTEFSRHGSRSKDGCPSAAIVNPYAATHQFYCHTCKVPMNSKDSYESHLKGQKHMAQVCIEPAPARTHSSPTVHLLSPDYLPQTKTEPRDYQKELFWKAMSDNTLCFLPTGTGKTQVAAMTISAMLQKCPTKNILFLVDKVLLVIQQAKYLRNELEEKSFKRFDPDSESCTSTVDRHIRIASVCMGQQSTGGIPLWKHDIVVITAAFCQNLLDKGILRWEDFSLVVFDEAHHCEKGHPFNSLLTLFHRPIQEQGKKPKILGLTASPAGKADVPKTVQMLETLIANMGNVRMNVVEDKQNLQSLIAIQSNSEMIIRPAPGVADVFEIKLKHEFNVYITYCVVKLLCISNIKSYVNLETLNVKMCDNEIQEVADSFVDSNLDEIQSSLNSIDLQNPNSMPTVQFALFRNHVQSICMALNSLEEGGTHCAREELVELEKTGSNFNFARDLGMPTIALQSLLPGQGSGMFEYLNGQDQGDVHLKRLLDELTDIPITGDKEEQKRISLVLVKQRSTVHHLTSVLQKSKHMLKFGLKTACVVGHGGGGSSDKGMSVNQQKRILEDIKQYKYQVVVATSVAEEGVDWPECERVISMYPPSTVTALVQMRGRARKKNSKFIVLCANAVDEETLHDILVKEKNMTEATNILVQRSRMK